MLPQHRSGARWRHAAATATFVIALAPAGSRAAYRDDVHFTQLQAELGAATPTGAGVAVGQVEGDVQVNGQSVWMPEVGNAEFVGKTLTDVSGNPAGLNSGHATAVAEEFYGLYTSIAPAINSVLVYWANTWFGSNYLWTGAARRPAYTVSRVVNHSWVGDGGTENAEGLRRLDYVIETDDVVHVVAQSAPNALLGSAFNVIAVGTTDGQAISGTPAIDTTYVSGRSRPDLVVPAVNLSTATPRVSAAAALLVQTGHGNAALSTDPVSTSFTNRAGVLIRNAERAEVIKAALMAGADRLTHNTSTTDLGLYRDTPANQTANGLDARYGAGQLNVQESYHIIAAGEQNSAEDGGPGVNSNATAGFDYDPAFGGTTGANTTATYTLPVADTPRLLTAALVWHLDINGGTQNNFNSTAYVRALSLTVLDVTNPALPVTVFTSQSAIDNTQNAWLVVPANTQYRLRVTFVSGPASGAPYDYALAWQLMNDADGDGAYDAQDNCINAANGPIVRDAGGNSQLDTDADGYGNACDGDLNNNGIANSQDFVLFRNALLVNDLNADINGNGVANVQDYVLFRSLLGLPPGPSGIAP